MSLSLQEIKDLIAFGSEMNLQQLSAEGVTVVYGPKPHAPLTQQEQADEAANLLAHYSAVGRQVSKR